MVPIVLTLLFAAFFFYKQHRAACSLIKRDKQINDLRGDLAKLDADLQGTKIQTTQKNEVLESTVKEKQFLESTLEALRHDLVNERKQTQELSGKLDLKERQRLAMQQEIRRLQRHVTAAKGPGGGAAGSDTVIAKGTNKLANGQTNVAGAGAGDSTRVESAPGDLKPASMAGAFRQQQQQTSGVALDAPLSNGVALNGALSGGVGTDKLLSPLSAEKIWRQRKGPGGGGAVAEGGEETDETQLDSYLKAPDSELLKHPVLAVKLLELRLEDTRVKLAAQEKARKEAVEIQNQFRQLAADQSLQIAALKRTEADLRSNLTSTSNSLAQSRTACEGLTSALAAESRRLSLSQVQVTALQGELTQLKDAHAEALKESARLAAKLTKAEEAVAALTEQRDKLKAKGRVLKQEVAALEEVRGTLLKDLEEATESHRSEVEAAERDVEFLRDERATLAEKLGEAEKKLAEGEEKLIEAEKKLGEAEEKFADATVAHLLAEEVHVVELAAIRDEMQCCGAAMEVLQTQTACVAERLLNKALAEKAEAVLQLKVLKRRQERVLDGHEQVTGQLDSRNSELEEARQLLALIGSEKDLIAEQLGLTQDELENLTSEMFLAAAGLDAADAAASSLAGAAAQLRGFVRGQAGSPEALGLNLRKTDELASALLQKLDPEAATALAAAAAAREAGAQEAVSVPASNSKAAAAGVTKPTTLLPSSTTTASPSKDASSDVSTTPAAGVASVAKALFPESFPAREGKAEKKVEIEVEVKGEIEADGKTVTEETATVDLEVECDAEAALILDEGKGKTGEKATGTGSEAGADEDTASCISLDVEAIADFVLTEAFKRENCIDDLEDEEVEDEIEDESESEDSEDSSEEESEELEEEEYEDEDEEAGIIDLGEQALEELEPETLGEYDGYAAAAANANLNLAEKARSAARDGKEVTPPHEDVSARSASGVLLVAESASVSLPEEVLAKASAEKREGLLGGTEGAENEGSMSRRGESRLSPPVPSEAPLAHGVNAAFVSASLAMAFLKSEQDLESFSPEAKAKTKTRGGSKEAEVQEAEVEEEEPKSAATPVPLIHSTAGYLLPRPLPLPLPVDDKEVYEAVCDVAGKSEAAEATATSRSDAGTPPTTTTATPATATATIAGLEVAQSRSPPHFQSLEIEANLHVAAALPSDLSRLELCPIEGPSAPASTPLRAQGPRTSPRHGGSGESASGSFGGASCDGDGRSTVAGTERAASSTDGNARDAFLPFFLPDGLSATATSSTATSSTAPTTTAKAVSPNIFARSRTSCQDLVSAAGANGVFEDSQNLAISGETVEDVLLPAGAIATQSAVTTTTEPPPVTVVVDDDGYKPATIIACLESPSTPMTSVLLSSSSSSSSSASPSSASSSSSALSSSLSDFGCSSGFAERAIGNGDFASPRSVASPPSAPSPSTREPTTLPPQAASSQGAAGDIDESHTRTRVRDTLVPNGRSGTSRLASGRSVFNPAFDPEDDPASSSSVATTEPTEPTPKLSSSGTGRKESTPPRVREGERDGEGVADARLGDAGAAKVSGGSQEDDDENEEEGGL